MLVNIHFSVNATEPFKEIARRRCRADLVANTPCISRFSRDTFLAFSSELREVGAISFLRLKDIQRGSLFVADYSLCYFRHLTERSVVDRRCRRRREGRSRRRRNSFVLFCRNFYADPSMDGARRPLCMLRGISSRHLFPSIRLSSRRFPTTRCT